NIIVAHLWSPEFSKLDFIKTILWWSRSVKVRMDEYTVVERGSIIKINRSMDKYFPPLPEKQILENVNKSLDRGECGYNWIFYNCEHFVNRCRYGFARYNFLSSEQIFKLPVILNCIILVTEFLL
ncbi:HRAS-like suppressor 3, partial [Biomphalaria glabrata]